MAASLRPLAILLLAGTAACQSSPEPTPPATMTLTVQIPVADKAVISAAEAVFAKRLTTLGMTGITSTVGDTMTFSGVVPDSFDLEAANAVLRNAGVFAFVPWPADQPTPEPGDPVPATLTPLFDAANEITAAELTTDTAGQRAIDITLGAMGSEAFATYTTQHVGSFLPFVMDGRVLAAPSIQSPITGGEILISIPDPDPLPLAAIAAMMASGPLPAAWSGGQP